VDSKLDVPVRIQYAAAFNGRVSLGAVPYSEWLDRSHRDRTRLTVSPPRHGWSLGDKLGTRWQASFAYPVLLATTHGPGP